MVRRRSRKPKIASSILVWACHWRINLIKAFLHPILRLGSIIALLLNNILIKTYYEFKTCGTCILVIAFFIFAKMKLLWSLNFLTLLFFLGPVPNFCVFFNFGNIFWFLFSIMLLIHRKDWVTIKILVFAIWFFYLVVLFQWWNSSYLLPPDDDSFTTTDFFIKAIQGPSVYTYRKEPKVQKFMKFNFKEEKLLHKMLEWRVKRRFLPLTPLRYW